MQYEIRLFITYKIRLFITQNKTPYYIKIGWKQRNDSVCLQPICFLYSNRALVIRLPQRGHIITAARQYCYRIAKIELPRRGNEPIHSINISSQYDFVDYFYYICIPSCSPCKGNTLIIRLLPLQGEWRCGVVMFTQGAALGYVIIGLSARL